MTLSKMPMETEPPLSDVYKIWLIMGQVYNAMSRARENELRPLGITMIQAGVLWLLTGLGRPASPAELSVMLFRKHHSVSQLLKRMEKQGLVERPLELQKSGAVRVVLTEKGRETLKQVYEIGTVIDDIMSGLTPEERRTLRSYLEKLHENAFTQLVEKPPFP
ncbi:MAG: MarR family transcriptional regulator [Chloroflexi bacterium]|nr:MarR family transcriptional regulator [Chloroflexota bacterium]